MAKQAERDAHVASLLREDGVHLALVPDLLAKATTGTGVIGTVADALAAALPFLRDDAGYRLRKARYAMRKAGPAVSDFRPCRVREPKLRLRRRSFPRFPYHP